MRAASASHLGHCGAVQVSAQAPDQRESKYILEPYLGRLVQLWVAQVHTFVGEGEGLQGSTEECVWECV